MDYLKAACPDSQKPFDAVVVGEALIDVVTTPDSQVEHPGGSPANVAYGLGLLGVTTGLLTAIAPDERGRTIENHLHRAGVTLLPGSKSLTRTATATAALGPDGSAAYDFDIRWQLPRATPACFPQILHTGSIATFLNPGAGAVKTLLEQAHKHCTITYDPNIRPSLLGSHAEAKATFEAIGALTDVVKLSDEDAQWLYPAKTLEETAEHILRLGAGLQRIADRHAVEAVVAVDREADIVAAVDPGEARGEVRRLGRAVGQMSLQIGERTHLRIRARQRLLPQAPAQRQHPAAQRRCRRRPAGLRRRPW